MASKLLSSLANSIAFANIHLLADGAKSLQGAVALRGGRSLRLTGVPAPRRGRRYELGSYMGLALVNHQTSITFQRPSGEIYEIANHIRKNIKPAPSTGLTNYDYDHLAGTIRKEAFRSIFAVLRSSFELGTQ